MRAVEADDGLVVYFDDGHAELAGGVEELLRAIFDFIDFNLFIGNFEPIKVLLGSMAKGAGSCAIYLYHISSITP